MTDKIEINDKVAKTVRELAEELLNKMGVEVSVGASCDKDNDAVAVSLDSPESTGLLIGKRGETIESIQSILSMMVSNKFGGWVRVLVDIADWREKKEATLNELADQAAERAIETGEDQHLYNLSPADRRIVHMRLAENDKIVSESEGEGSERYLVVKPK